MYGKIFETIFDSSIMEEDIETRYVWHCMIVLADVDGNVDMTEEALARRINVHVSTVSTAVHKLSQPDARSRSAAEDGRRLVLIDEHRSWGWHLVNRERYKDIRSPLDRRDYFREQKRRKRAESLSTKEKCGQSGQSTASTNAEAEADIKKEKEASLPFAPSPTDSSPAEPPVLVFPVTGDREQPEWGLTAKKLEEYRETWPTLDVEASARSALQWCRDNPGQRKTARGMPRFLGTWFRSDIDKSRNLRAGRSNFGASPASSPYLNRDGSPRQGFPGTTPELLEQYNRPLGGIEVEIPDA